MIHWITPHIGTGSYDQAKKVFDAQLIDVRDLVDKAGNTIDAVKSKIDHALAYLKKGNKVILCCDHGMSRSNAVAAGVLASYEKISLDHSLKRILQVTGEKNIKIEVLSVLRRLLDTKGENMSLDTPRVLVTGSSGFIGAGLIPLLNQRFSYVCTPKHHDTDLIPSSRESQATRLPISDCRSRIASSPVCNLQSAFRNPETHSPTSVVLPKPAGAETRVNLRWSPSFSRATRRGRDTSSGRMGGI